MVYDIEKIILNSMFIEILLKDIGEMVMIRLKEVDEIFYVRFVLVYR